MVSSDAVSDGSADAPKRCRHCGSVLKFVREHRAIRGGYEMWYCATCDRNGFISSFRGERRISGVIESEV
jgi:hypothetical protein